MYQVLSLVFSVREEGYSSPGQGGYPSPVLGAGGYLGQGISIWDWGTPPQPGQDWGPPGTGIPLPAWNWVIPPHLLLGYPPPGRDLGLVTSTPQKEHVTSGSIMGWTWGKPPSLGVDRQDTCENLPHPSNASGNKAALWTTACFNVTYF